MPYSSKLFGESVICWIVCQSIYMLVSESVDFCIVCKYISFYVIRWVGCLFKSLSTNLFVVLSVGWLCTRGNGLISPCLYTIILFFILFIVINIYNDKVTVTGWSICWSNLHVNLWLKSWPFRRWNICFVYEHSQVLRFRARNSFEEKTFSFPSSSVN